MNELYILLIIANVFSHLDGEKNINSKDQGLALKSILRGVYEKPENSLGNESKFYFLVEVTLMNNLDSSLKFLTTTCATASNIVIDSKDFKPCVNNCNGNSITTITLNPKQKFSVFLILETNEKISSRQIKLGWILLTFKNTGSPQNYYKVLDRSRKKSENLIWSDPIELQNGGGYPYEIK